MQFSFLLPSKVWVISLTMCACTHCVREKTKQINKQKPHNFSDQAVQLKGVGWGINNTFLVLCSHVPVTLTFFPRAGHTHILTRPFCPSWSWSIAHGMMGRSSAQATFPWSHQGTAGAEEPGHAGFRSSSNGAVISNREPGHRQDVSFIHEPLELGWRHNSQGMFKFEGCSNPGFQEETFSKTVLKVHWEFTRIYFPFISAMFCYDLQGIR